MIKSNDEWRLRMEKKEVYTKICRWLIALFLPIALLLSILQVYAFNVNFYLDRFQENNTPQITKINIDDLETVTTNLIGYLKSEDRKSVV